MSAPRHLPVLCLALAMLLPAGAARADAIDGNWCFADGRHMVIRGPKIITPAGRSIQGDYGRHSFSYTVPAAEPGAGSQVSMILVNPSTIHLQIGGAAGTADGPVQVWRRCDLTT